MPKKVGIILVNYQDYATRFLIACRDSLRAQTYPSDLFQVYIVDNASSPESRDFLKNNYSEAVILSRADGNYAAANNLGFRRAQADGCQYLLTLNMDTELAPDCLAELVKGLDSNQETAIVQAKILLYPKNEAEKTRPKINSLGNIFHFLGFGFTSHYQEEDRLLGGYPEIKGYASGCAFMIRTEFWEKTGFYNEDFYMYHDDIELSLKVRLAGGKIRLAPAAKVYHKYEFERSRQMLYYMERNRLLTIFSFYPFYLLLLIAPPFIFLQIGMFFYALISAWAKTALAVYGYFLRPSTYVKIYRYRRDIRRWQVLKFSRLALDFSGRIEFQEIANPVLNKLVNPLLDLYWRLIRKII